MKVKSESEVAQQCPTLLDPMDCSLPGSSVHGIFQARVLEWGAIAFSLGCLYLVTKICRRFEDFTQNPSSPQMSHILGYMKGKPEQFRKTNYKFGQTNNKNKQLHLSNRHFQDMTSCGVLQSTSLISQIKSYSRRNPQIFFSLGPHLLTNKKPWYIVLPFLQLCKFSCRLCR